MNKFTADIRHLLPGHRRHPLKQLPQDLLQKIQETPHTFLPQKKKKTPWIPILISANIVLILTLILLAYFFFLR